MKAVYSLLICFGLSPFSLFAQKVEGSRVVIGDSIEVDLPEVFVKAERPLVVVSEGKLKFDIPSLIKNKPVDTAFDVLGELPGVQKEGDKVTIIGTPSTTILINGRKSSMTTEQVVDLLKSTSAAKVKTMSVMYSTPPRFGVRGGAINIVLEEDRSLQNVLKGEVAVTGRQAHSFSPSGRVNMSYIRKRYSVDVSYSADRRRGYYKEDMSAWPEVNGQMYDISQKNWYKTNGLSHDVRGILDLNLDNEDQITFAYTGSYNDPDKKSYRGAVTDFAGIREVQTESELSYSSGMHNARVDYKSHTDLSLGMDYTFSRDRDIQQLTNKSSGENDETIQTLFRQRVNRLNFYLNDSHTLKGGWQLNYGVDASFSDTYNESGQELDGTADGDGTFRLRQRDYAASGFVGFTKKLGKKISLDASLSLQYYKAAVDSAGKKKDLWNRVSPFPQFTFTYRINPSNTLVLSFSSDKTYPSYWMTTPNTHYMNVYSSIVGNPDLKPQSVYSGVLNYIVKGKYVFGAFADIQPDKMNQQTYQYQDRLQSVLQTINLDIHTIFGMMAVVPFKVGSFMSSRLVLSGCAIHDKGTLYTVSFDRKKLFGRAALNNTFYLTKKRDLSLELSGYCISPVIQGMYDIDRISNVSAGLVWTFAKNRLRMTVRGEDLFGGRSPVTHVDEQGQKSRMKLNQDTRNVTLTVRYTFGGYKEKKVREVDTSRLGTD